MAASFSMTKPPLCLSYKKRLNPAPSQRVSWLRPHGLECKSNGRVSGSQTCGNATPPLPSQFCSGIRRGRVPASAKWGCDVTERSHLGEPGGACLWICRACRVSAARYHVLTLPATPGQRHSPSRRLIRPISARYPDGLSLRACERILVKRLESRSRQFLEEPSGRDLRNISIAC